MVNSQSEVVKGWKQGLVGESRSPDVFRVALIKCPKESNLTDTGTQFKGTVLRSREVKMART